MVTLLFIYLLVGALVGILAGLLGVGGGLVIVPMLLVCMTKQGLPPDNMMHLALGTSLASIIFTSASSFWAHHQRGAVRWDAVRQLTPGILTGTFLGSGLAAMMSTQSLKLFFVLFLFFVAAQLFIDRKPTPSRNLPGWLGLFGAGNAVGSISSLIGIGGGAMTVPFLMWCNVPVHLAIGTSAAVGFPIAIAGAFGYVYHGLAVTSLPSHCFGFVYLPALAGIVIASVVTAPLGVRLAHALPVVPLKRIFALLLMAAGIRMMMTLF